MSICLVFVVQMGLDVALMLKKAQDNEVVFDGEDDAEKEVEKELEDEKEENVKNIMTFHYLSFQKQISYNTIARQRKQLNLPAVFITKFSQPPEQIIL